MDDIVKAALAKWPNVPHCHGWLALDARGDWYMRDDRVQAAGPFPQVKGSRIEHEQAARVHRSQLRGATSRVPGSSRTGRSGSMSSSRRRRGSGDCSPWKRVASHCVGHTDAPARYRAALLDEHGRVFVATDLGLGLVHSLDIETAAEMIESGRWLLEDVRFDDLPRRFGYLLSPAAALR